MEQDFESRIVDFLQRLKAKQNEEIMRILAPAVSNLSALATAFTHLHRFATATGASLADLKDELRSRGVSNERIDSMVAEVRAAQDAFANEIAQAALEAMLDHFSSALQVADQMLRDRDP